jgi:hypothetical protein
LIGLLQIGIRAVAIEVRGDSTAALTGAIKGRPKGVWFGLLCIHGGFRATKGTWISGNDNKRCDVLSRLGNLWRLDECRAALDKMGISKTEVVVLEKKCTQSPCPM